MADWTEVHRPTSLAEIRGNDSAREDLREWAETWTDHREAIILHGSPGVGKTSAAHALASEMGWEVIELNASDQRTADAIDRIAGEAAKSGTLSGGEAGRKLIILDEADDLHGNADRGGTGAITSLVKSANQPIVLIANEYYEMSQGLRGACRDIEFRDIATRSIIPVLRDICRKEEIEYEDAALQSIAEQNEGDLRGAIKDLQAAADSTATVTTETIATAERDRTEGVFPFLDSLLKEADAETALRSSYDVDETPDDLINWIEENIPKEYTPTELADGYDALATADVWLGRVRATQDYSYWRYATDAMTAGVAASRETEKSGWTRYSPPSYWRKLGSSRSTRDKRDRVAKSIADQSGVSIGIARREILPYLSTMTHHCRNRELTVTMAAAYDLDADHVAFVTGSGKDTNKVQSIIEDAQARREEETVNASQGAFAGSTATVTAPDSDEDASTNGPDEDSADDDADNGQSGLTDFA